MGVCDIIGVECVASCVMGVCDMYRCRMCNE